MDEWRDHTCGGASSKFANRSTRERTTKIICFHKFARLWKKRGASAQSPEFEGLGNQWCLSLREYSHSKGSVSICLANMSNKAIKIVHGVSIIDGDGKQVTYKGTETPHCFGNFGSVFPALRWLDYAKCSTLMNSLVDGALIVKVNMKMVSPSTFILPNPSACEVIQGLFLSTKSADIVFEVGIEEQPKDNAMKTAKTATVTFPAHRCIVENCSTTLAELLESNGNGTTPIPIDNLSPDIFRLLLSYIYGMKISNDDMKSHAREIINAADRFGVVNLKLEAEASIVEDTIFTLENVKELLLFAESKNCALLKEAAMDYIVENKADAIEELSFTDIPGTLLNDVLVAFIRSEKEDGAGAGLMVLLPCVSVNYARRLTRKVLMLTGQGKCSSLLSN